MCPAARAGGSSAGGKPSRRGPPSGPASGGPGRDHHAGEQFRPHQAGDLLRIFEVPPARCRDVGQHHAGQEVGGFGEVDTGGQSAPGDEGRQHPGDALPDPVALDGEDGQQLVRFGLHHPLEHLVLEDGPVGEHDAPLHHLLQAVRSLDPLVETPEEVERRPGHGGVDQLVTAAGECPVHGGTRHAGLPGHVLDGRLGDPSAGDAGVRRLDRPLAGVVHRRPGQIPRSGSRPMVNPGRVATCSTARTTPSMNEERWNESWRMVRPCPVAPSTTSWWATRPGRRTACMRIPPGPAPPRAPSTTTALVASAGKSSRPADRRAAAIPSAVRSDVPDGASRFPSWCSSMISAPSNHGAAMAANRIMSTAPMAKLAASTQLAPWPVAGSKTRDSSSRSDSVNPVEPTTEWIPAPAQKASVARAASRWVKSTTTSQPDATISSRAPATIGASTAGTPTSSPTGVPA